MLNYLLTISKEYVIIIMKDKEKEVIKMIKNQALQALHVLNKSDEDVVPKRVERLVVAVSYLTGNEKQFTLYCEGAGYSIVVSEPASNGQTCYSIDLATEKSRITLDGIIGGDPVFTGKLANREALDYIQSHSNNIFSPLL